MKSLTWQKEKITKGSVYPIAREGHTITHIPNMNSILMFGGINSTRMNDVYLYDLSNNIWKLVQTTGRQPTGRCYHVAFYEEPNFFIHGGQADKNRSVSDFFFLNLKTNIWRRLFILEAPPSRHFHTMSDMNNQEKEKIVFGGVNLPDNTLLNDVWTVNYSNVAFNSPLPEIPGTVWTQKKTKGDTPSARKGHGAAVYNNYLYIFCGQSAILGEDTNQIHFLNLDNWTWKKASGISKPNGSRAFFSHNLFNEKTVLVFGGKDPATNKYLNDIYLLNLEDLHWSCPFVAGYQPSGRYNHGSCYIKQKAQESALMILGGLDNACCPMDVYFLFEADAKDNVKWEKLQEPSMLDNYANELAGQTILENKNYMNELDKIIIQERDHGVELDQEIKKLEEELLKAQKMKQEKIENLNGQIKTLDDEYNTNFEITKDLLSMIPIEQLISCEINRKNMKLEDLIQKIQEYLIHLDQLFTAISRSKLDENDMQEYNLKKIIDNSKDDISKARDLHRIALTTLKQVYDQFNEFSNRNETDLNAQRKVIIAIDKDYEQILYQCELDDAQIQFVGQELKDNWQLV